MSDEYPADDLTLQHVSRALRREWKVIGLCTLAVGCLMTLLSFLLPKSYVATSTILPTSSSDRMSSLSKIAAGLVDLDIQPRSLDEAIAAYPVIIQSRRLATRLLAMRFPRAGGRDSAYLIDMIQPKGSGAKRLDNAARALSRSIGASIDRRTGVLEIEVSSRDPVTSAAVVNSIDSLLQDFLIQSSAEQASQQRRFLEERLADTQQRLSTCEDDLRTFRERNVRTDRSPRLQLEEGRLARLVREQEEVYLTLRREYEMAKIAEHKNVPTISIVDPPTVPVSHHWPPRRLFAVAGLLAGFLLGCAVAVRRQASQGGS